MSVNQLRPEKNTLIYRKSGSGKSNLNSGHHFRPVAAAAVGTGSVSGPITDHHSLKKSNNAHGGQSKGNFGSVTTPTNLNSSSADNGGHAQPTSHGVSQTGGGTAVPKAADTSSQKSQPNSNTPSSHSSSMTSDTAPPSTPPKGDPGKGFSLQFGSLSPGIMNGPVVPPRISSAPPNLDEQQPKQAQINASLQATSSVPIPATSNEQDMTRTEQPLTHGAHKRDSSVSSTAPPVMPVHNQRPPILHTTGMTTPMPMPFHHPNVPMQFGGAHPHMGNTPLPVSMQVPLPMGNASQVHQQPIFMPGLQHQMIQTHGIMHPGHGLGFNPPLGPPLPRHLAPNMPPQLANARKTTVKITHPETHEELRLDKDGSPRSRPVHIRPQQSQPLGSYYPNSYGGGPPFFPVPNSLPLANAQLPSSPQGPRFNYPLNQGFPTMPTVKHASPVKGGVAIRGMLEPLPSDLARDAQNVLPSSQSTPREKDIPMKSDSAIKDGSDHSKASAGQDGSGDTPSGVGHVEPVSVNDSDISTNATSSGSVTVCETPMAKELAEKETIGGPQSDVSLQADLLEGSSPHNGDKTVSNSTSVPSKMDGLLENGASSASSNLSGMNQGQNGEGVENSRANPSLDSNKPPMESSNTKHNKSKKKRKEMLQKADAQDTTSDLYMAYKGPEKKEACVSVQGSLDGNLKNVTAETKPVSRSTKKNNKPELEDWENAPDIPVSKETGVTKRKYSRDFLLTLLEQCTDLPEGFEITSDIADVFVHTNAGPTRGYREHPSTGKTADRSSGGMRRGNGVMDGDRLGKLPGGHPLGRGPGVELGYGGKVMGFRPGPGPNFGVRGQGPVQYLGGILSEPMYSMGLQRNKPDERWQRAANFNRGPMPSSQSPLPSMHKAEIKYEVGKVTDEEQAKQRRLKAILNKLTPQNFDKLFEQVKEVNIDNAVTLTGVISQIFDKALMEPTFCEMYANFCYHLASELPDLSVDNEKITFKRLLLNKCQEEFERGEREEEEANKVDGEGDTELSEAQREEKRLKARRRMLGNIRLIGELYKKRMLTERIMHECIKKLLGQYHNPDEENIEALCKLMSTIGEMIDHSKAKEHMDAYFDIMGQLSGNMKLSSRVRFMLRDAIDLRKNKWQQRRKVEGPKKIEEVHRDVAKERQGQAGRMSRGPSSASATRRGPPVEYVSRGSVLPGGGGFKGPPTQARGYAGKDVLENRTPLSVPVLQRSSADESSITLGPQGGLARGMSYRGQALATGPTSADASSFHGDPRKTVVGSNGWIPVSDHAAANSSRDEGVRRVTGISTANDRLSVQHSQVEKGAHRCMSSEAGVPSAQSHTSEKVWPEERLRDMSIAAIKEYYSAKDEKEVALCIKDLNAPSFYPTVVSIWVTDAFERKDKERDMLAQLLVGLAKPREGIFSQDQLIEGFESVLTNLEDTVTDAPRAPEFLGHIFGKVISENILPLKDLGRLIHQGGEEPGRLLEAGLAADILGSILETIKLQKGESVLNEIRSSSNLRLEDFRSSGSIRSKKLEMFII